MDKSDEIPQGPTAELVWSLKELTATYQAGGLTEEEFKTAKESILKQLKAIAPKE